MPILPSGPHKAHSLIHIIREQPSQIFFRGRDIPISALIKQFPVVFTEWLQSASMPGSQTPPSPPSFFKVSFIIIIIAIINGGLVANSDAQTAEKSGQESTT